MRGRDELGPEELARACAAALWRDDAASRALGMAIEDIAPGRARLSMTIRPDMVNGLGLCHGGLIFTLADSAFAFACNTHNQRAVAQHCSVTFVHPARLGAVLVAEAVERGLSGRSGIYDVTVREDLGREEGSGRVIAEFRGHSRLLEQTFFPEEAGGDAPR